MSGKKSWFGTIQVLRRWVGAGQMQMFADKGGWWGWPNVSGYEEMLTSCLRWV